MLQASPPASAAALDALETDGGAKAVVVEPQVAAELRAARRECTDALAAFRKAHMALVRAFILAPAGFKPGGGEGGGGGGGGGGPVGTGGSSLLDFLSGRLMDTVRA